MGVQRATRKDDEAVLNLLALRRLMTSGGVGQLVGLTDTAVRVATNRVVRADLAEGGEDPVAVSAQYAFFDGRSV